MENDSGEFMGDTREMLAEWVAVLDRIGPDEAIAIDYIQDDGTVRKLVILLAEDESDSSLH